jgi:hypothetical protein
LTVFEGFEVLEEALARGFVGKMGVVIESVRVKAAGSMDIVVGR